MPSAFEDNDRATGETVTAQHRWAPGLYSFKTTRPPGYRFAAGQYARLGLPNADGNVIWRAYSIVSSSAAGELEFYVVDVPGGTFTAMLRRLLPGDAILLDRQSFGVMLPDRFTGGTDLWMIATGTGLGPFISILREPQVWQRFHHLVLVHSVRQPVELAYHDELIGMQNNARLQQPGIAELHLIQTCTRNPVPTAAGTREGMTARITTMLQSGELEKQAGLPISAEASRFMLCGNPAMINDMRQLLKERGLRPVRRDTPGQYLAENYW